jgi:hypothetical protein
MWPSWSTSPAAEIVAPSCAPAPPTMFQSRPPFAPLKAPTYPAFEL